MNATRQIASRMLDELSDEMVSHVISYIHSIKRDDQNEVFKELANASMSSTDFWDNPIDDEVWNNA